MVCSTFSGTATNGLADLFEHQLVFISTNPEVLADEYANDPLTYAAFSPEGEGKHPLIVWLHGAGGGGYDTYQLTGNNKSTFLVDAEVQGYMGGAYVLMPQCETAWINATGKGYDLTAENPASIYTKPLMELIESYVAANSGIDTDRIYIGGCSNGGYML